MASGIAADRLALAVCALFVLCGQVFIPKLGIEDDEALFAAGIFPPHAELYAVRLGPARLPVMLMTYMGTVKTWLFRPIFSMFGTSVWALREPALLAGALSLWMFYRIVRAAVGNTAGVVACVLLAADPLYLLTCCFDWGPVALQHLLLISAMFAGVRFIQSGNDRYLACASLLAGVAIWDKAVAMWFIIGVTSGAGLVFWRAIASRATLRSGAVGVAAFMVGAFPLIAYNLNTHYRTLRDNARYDIRAVPAKAEMVGRTLSGEALFGFLNAEDWETPEPRRPATALDRASAAISEMTGHPRRGLLGYVFAAALLAVLFVRGRDLRTVLASLIAMVVAWVQMAIVEKGGTGVHHTILLWPLPVLIVAVSLTAVSRRLRWGPVVVLLPVLCVTAASELLVLNEYYTTIVANGGTPRWTNATVLLSRYVRAGFPRGVVCVDWGIIDTLRLESGGNLPLRSGYEEIWKADTDPEDRVAVQRMIAGEGNVFVGHAAEAEFFRGNTEKLVKLAEEIGWRREMIKEVADSHGRPIFQLFRFRQ